jgi:hypothetical protein
MEHAARDLFLTWRRLLAAVLIVTLLVSFWAERPSAAASVAQIPSELRRAINPNASAAPIEPTKTSILHLLRRPWLGFYTAVGAPDLNHGRLTPAEESQFRRAVGRLAGCFFALGAILWLWGHRVARHALRS